MHDTFTRVPLGSVRLLPVVNRPGSTPSFSQRAELNRNYVMSLANEHLLQNHYLEAGLWQTRGQPQGIHWGWESPTCQVRGHFLGHWLSAAARIWAATGDVEVKAKADRIVSELGRCQQENGGEWVSPFPEKYRLWNARGKTVWAPQYVVHKTLMGLNDMGAFAQNEQALDILANAARWFHRWTGQFSREELDDILDVETGGMLEAWADLYGATGREEHLDLVHRYDRPRLFDRLLAGEDALTNRHANTTIPEAHGAARAWEVTGEQRWRDIAFAYWDQAVTKRGYYATGGQNCGEFWTAPNELSARLGDKTQEHCTVYNMMRLAEYLLRWTGDVQYADYWERNLVNGILAQQHPATGMISYFLPLNPGATKNQTNLPRLEKTYWGSPTDDFWCCHGSLVQAHAAHVARPHLPGDSQDLLDLAGRVVDPGHQGSDQDARGYPGPVQLADRRQARARMRGVRLARPPRPLFQGRDREVRDELGPRRDLAKQLDVPQEQRRLGQDRAGIGEVAHRLPDPGEQPVARLDPLVRVRVRPQGDVGSPPGWPCELGADQLGHVHLHDDLALEVPPGVEIEVLVGRASEAIDPLRRTRGCSPGTG